MTDPELKAGDVAHDLVKRGKVLVVERVAESVDRHRERNDYDIAEYKANALLGVSESESVWRCVYLPDEPSTSFSGTYDFPRSRLARIPVENAREDLRRPQHGQAVTMLAALFSAALAYDDAPAVEDLHTLGNYAGFSSELLEEARELAEADSEADIETNE